MELPGTKNEKEEDDFIFINTLPAHKKKRNLKNKDKDKSSKSNSRRNTLNN